MNTILGLYCILVPKDTILATIFDSSSEVNQLTQVTFGAEFGTYFNSVLNVIDD